MWYNGLRDGPMTTPEIIPQEPEYEQTFDQPEQSDALQVVLPMEPVFEPSTRQLERAKEIRRFNLLYIYFPIVSLSLVVLLLVLALIYLGLNPPALETLQTLSGIADAVVILGLIPTIILCGIFPTLVIGVTVQARKQGIAPIQQLQVLLWRLDRLIGTGRMKVDEVAPKIARPFINIHATVAYIKTLFKQIIRIFKRS